MLLLTAFFFGCQTTKKYDLIIYHAKVLDTITGTISDNQTILISNGKIEDIEKTGKSYTAKKTIDANGKLVTPSFIDCHIHPTDVWGDYEKAPKFLPQDSLYLLKKRLSDEYLPYGTTTVMTMGQPESWLKDLVGWQKKRDSNTVNFFICGGALISKDNRTPYIAHTEITSPEMAKQKILEYHDLGIRHIKLYYRLKEPEFSTVIKLADSLKMRVYGHIGDFSPGYLTLPQTLKLGLNNYEHLATIPNSIITSDEDWAKLEQQFKENYGALDSENKMIEFLLEQFRFIKENKDIEMQEFIKELKKQNATFSTTIHRLYEQIEPTFFTQPKDTTLTEIQLKRSQENYAIMMQYVKLIADSGIEIRLGSDMPNGGKVNLSELVILAKYGFAITDIFRIATYNGAKAIGIENEVGSIAKGKKADLIIWDKSPFDDYDNFISPKTIIKDGITVE